MEQLAAGQVPQLLLEQTPALGQSAVFELQFPAPSQVWVVSFEPVHEEAPQEVPLTVVRHAPAPSQFPSRPQGGFAVQVLCASVPAVTG